MFSRGSQVRMFASTGGGGGGQAPKGGKEFFNFPATRITGEEIK